MAEPVSDVEEKLYPYPGKVKSRVWEYFRFRKAQEGPPIKANLDMENVICILCKKTYSNKGNTTNLQFHLDNHHKGTCEKPPSQTTQPKIDQAIKGKGVVPPRMSKQRQDEIDDALMQLMVQKVLPLSLVEHDKFLKFVELLDSRYKVPKRSVLLNRLEKKKQEIESKIRNEISTCHDIAITHDGWTSCNTQSYSTVTGHYIDQEWNLKSVSLSTSKTDGAHTSENIAKELENVKTQWNLPNCIAVTDNAANERKAFEILDWVRFGCYGHRVNLVVRHALEEPSAARLIGKGRKLVGFFHQSSSANDILMDKQIKLSTCDTPLKLIQDVVTRWNSTFSMLTRLNLLIPAIVATANDPSVSKSAANTIKGYSFSFEEQALSERLVSLLQPFQNATDSVSSETSPTMQKIMPILLALEKYTAVSDDDTGAIRAVKERMTKELEKRTQDVDLALLACVLNPFTKHLGFLDPTSKARALALLEENALDQFHESAGSACVKVKQEPGQSNPALPEEPGQSNPALPELPAVPPLIQDMIESDIKPMLTPSTDSAAETTSAYMPSPAKKVKVDSVENQNMDDWLSDVVCVGESVEAEADTIKMEISRYLGSRTDQINPVTEKKITILEWWKENEIFYPRLSILAKKYLCVPASSIPSERIFSLCGTLVSKKRSRLSPLHVGMLVFLNRNLKHFW